MSRRQIHAVRVRYAYQLAIKTIEESSSRFDNATIEYMKLFMNCLFSAPTPESEHFLATLPLDEVAEQFVKHTLVFAAGVHKLHENFRTIGWYRAVRAEANLQERIWEYRAAYLAHEVMPDAVDLAVRLFENFYAPFHDEETVQGMMALLNYYFDDSEDNRTDVSLHPIPDFQIQEVRQIIFLATGAYRLGRFFAHLSWYVKLGIDSEQVAHMQELRWQVEREESMKE